MNKTHVLPGSPYPLGATWDGQGTNFALFSAHAEKVELCLFDTTGRHEKERIVMPEYTDQVWHCYLADARPGQLYGYRVYGPYEPTLGHRFNHHKLLLDPYAKKLVGPFKWSDSHFGYIFDSNRADLSFDRRNNENAMPKCAVVDEAFSWSGDHMRLVPFDKTIFYELHVRGFTKLKQELPAELRGTFGGLGHPKTIQYLKDLGVTSVELLPVFAFIDDQFLVKRNLQNYWGYNTLNFFAPEPRYMGPSGFYDFKTMVKRLHDAGLEVILDVVYNHTAESNHLGPTLSLRGIDNRSYYLLEEGRYYTNYSGCGNTLNLAHPRVLQMVMDSLRYWAQQMHVDGFRFDLATTLGREPHGFDPGSGFLDAIGQDPVLSRLKLIAEPWDLGPGGYALGGFPCGWAEWNDQARDCTRRYWNMKGSVLPDLARRLHGSADKFEHSGRHPWASINFAACHDGFTLEDLVSYNQRHNLANNEGNQDGSPHENSFNWGEEGPSQNPEINLVRARVKRSMLATIMLSQGTPLLLMGDEVQRSQKGNNNAYCQDSELSWMGWEFAPEQKEMLDFVKRLINLRHKHPVLRRSYFLHGKFRSGQTGFKDVSWYGPDGQEMGSAEWHNPDERFLGMLLAGDAGKNSSHDPKLSDDTLFIVFNAANSSRHFKTPNCDKPISWSLLLETYSGAKPRANQTVRSGQTVLAEGHSLYVYALKRGETRSKKPRSSAMNLVRQSGVVLHPTSLPGPCAIGQIGASARAFVKTLARMGVGIWQVLPLGPTSYGDSPYSCLSSFAGNHILIDFDDLVSDGFLDPEDLADYPGFDPNRVNYGMVFEVHNHLLTKVAQNFKQRASAEQQAQLKAYCEAQAAWLDEYTLYMALKEASDGLSWPEWRPAWAKRQPKALQEARLTYADSIERHQILQYIFAEQWLRLRACCREHGIKIMGDIPIFMAHDSVDVWAAQRMFQLDEKGQPTVVAGVPPDYYSENGQRWGNPLYRWDLMEKDHFSWWVNRLASVLASVDLVRIDHFRGFESYWEIPAAEATAVNGRWVPAPGDALFTRFRELFPEAAIIVEDLGDITPMVEELRDAHDLPGMKVIQFMLAGEEAPDPVGFPEISVCYTGTHDNDTSLGWFNSLEPEIQELVKIRLGIPEKSEVPVEAFHFIKAAWSSNSFIAIAPLQDLLGLGGEARLNLPGRLGENWDWRFQTSHISETLIGRVHALNKATKRLSSATSSSNPPSTPNPTSTRSDH